MTLHLQLLLISVAGWMNRHQQAAIDYLEEENRVLLEQLDGQPKRFTDSQLVRLARKAKVVDPKRLRQLTTIVTPDTLLRWFRATGPRARVQVNPKYCPMKRPAALLAIFLLVCARPLPAAELDIAKLKTFSAIGKELPVLNGYHEAELLRHRGKGCLTHMWFGGDWPGYDRTRIRVYVDAEEKPSIEMELGLGHGVGFNDNGAPWGSEKLGKTGHPSGFYNTYRVPFGKSIRVTAQRDNGSPDGAPFWWILRGTDNLPVTIAGARLPENARLKLHKLENHVAKPLEEFALCDVSGAGALYQVTIAAEGLGKSTDWTALSFLEAIMRAYIDGAKTPTQLSSGLEDYFLGTYYFNRGRYANGLAGLTHLDTKNNSFSAYRFHDDDPVVFKSGLRLTCRCGEQVNGKTVGNPPETRYTTYAWVYQW